MTIEHGDVRKPQNNAEIFALALDLKNEFFTQDLVLQSNPKFGGIGRDYFGFQASELHTNKDLGFLQIIFDPDGWTALANLTEEGKSVLQALSKAIGRNPEEMKLQELKMALPMYRTHFLYEQPDTQVTG